MNNPVFKLLENLGVCSLEELSSYHPTVRDTPDISVLQCRNTEALFLSDKAPKKNYSTLLDYWKVDSVDKILDINFEDDNRRFNQYKRYAAKRRYMDVGSGVGGVLSLFSTVASEVVSVEPGPSREYLVDKGFKVYTDIDDAEEEGYDFISLFHVFEHLEDPIGMLFSIHKKLAPKGRAILEVPHAKDFLLSFLNCESFKKFTFWSDHLVLHTRQTLQAILRETPFSNSYTIESYQRHPVSNHLYWLSKGKPGGHKRWDFLSSNALDEHYSKALYSIDASDTLIINLYKE